MMFKSFTVVLFLVFSACFFAAEIVTYTNPVITRSTPDPTLIRAADGYFYLYATEDIRNTPIYRSNNLVDWSLMGTAFTNATRPTFEPNGGLWAPDINYIDGKYVLYYSMSVWGGEWTCGIGVATADKPEGPFTDKGKLFRSNEIGVQNSIDPFYMEDNGKKYLFWGSFRGIYYVELADNGLALKNPGNPQPQQVAGTAFEGVYIYKRGDYYFMFASIGSCCNGINSTYRLVVGRSNSLTGPYYNKQGDSMMSNGYSLVVGSNSRFVGNGHCSEIVSDEAGNDWIFFHGWDVDFPDNKRGLLLNKISWDRSGWPYVTSASPSITAEAPVFGTSGQRNVYEGLVQLQPGEKSLTIQSSLPVSAKVYTTTGQLLDAVVVNEQAQIRLATGIYIIRIHINGYSMVKKIFIS